MHRILSVVGVLTFAFAAHDTQAQDRSDREFSSVDQRIETALAKASADDLVRFPIGRSNWGSLIWCVAEPEALDLRSNRQRRLIVGGLDGSAHSAEIALAAIVGFSDDAESDIAWACIPIANPDAWQASPAPVGPQQVATDWTFPPQGPAYNVSQTRAAEFLWRFIGWFAPDVVEEIHTGSLPERQPIHNGQDARSSAWPKDSLAASVRSTPVAGIAPTLSLRCTVSLLHDRDPLSSEAQQAITAVVAKLRQPASGERLGGQRAIGTSERSALRNAVRQRLERTPLQVADQLAQHYGHHLQTVMYQPALALVARLRLGQLQSTEMHRDDIEEILAPYLAGEAVSLPAKTSGSHFAGHLIFSEWAGLTGSPQAVELVQRAAEFGFDANGHLREAMPFHNEMSDAVFMACPILTAVSRHTSEEKYLQMAERHLRYMQQLCVRDDGIYRHSPLCEAAWGRGNGFPALGLAWSLSDLEQMADSPAVRHLQDVMQQSLAQHLEALVEHQDEFGMWHQVIDDPGSYRELTSTCMITYAIVRGIRSGWLDAETYSPVARRAWEAIKVRVGEDGKLLDVCTGTGKQRSLQDYRDRTAILGQDARGGAMALLAAVEFATWEAHAAANQSSTGTVRQDDQTSAGND